MPYSYGEFKQEIKNHISSILPQTSKILDVGPGCGTYSHLLKEFGYIVDCVEIWEPYIHKFNLNQHYDNVHLSNVMDFDITPYEYIIMGDILEHLSSEDAILFLKKIEKNKQKVLVAVPYEYKQGEHEGNIFETHLQPDLTPEIMKLRYPNLKLLYGDNKYGYYINYNLNMKDILMQEYNNLTKTLKIPLFPQNHILINFVNGAKVEVKGENSKKYQIQFINKNNNKIIHESTISNNMWTKTNVQYFIDYKIIVKDLEENTITEHYFNAKDKKVYIHFASKALGDTIAWFPYAEEFRKKHQCELVVSTFHNEMFEENYPNIKFVKPGETQYDLYAMYEVGWHYNENQEINYNKNISNFREIGLQDCSSESLGISPIEIKPKLTYKNTGSTVKGDYVVIAPHGSAHAKYWNYEGGWQTVIDYLNNKGYKVVMITQEPLGDEWHDSKLGGTLTGVIDKTGNYPLSERANDMMNAKAFIGIGSGLSWLAWALNTPVVMISGFSEAYSEFKDCERISSPKNKCSGCFNRTQLDAGDWEWCPDHKGTSRIFECTKSITPDIVIAAIDRQLEKFS